MPKRQRSSKSGTAHSRAQLDRGVDRKPNPFEARSNKRQRHTVLNRKTKGSKRNVGQTRARGHQKRVETIGAEFRDGVRKNTFIDQRFGEGDKEMSHEEQMLERFKLARQKQNYDAQESRDDAITTRAGFFGGEDDDDDEVEKLDANALMDKLRLGGVAGLMRRSQESNQSDEGEPHERKRTRKEIMNEVMMKSKLFKAERQQVKEQDEQERERLDEAMKDIMADGLVQMRPTKREERFAMLERLEAQNPSGKRASDAKRRSDKAQATSETVDKFGDFDKMCYELRTEARAAATDRSKTEEEIAKEEREALEQLEAARLRRMRGVIDDDEEEEEEEENAGAHEPSSSLFGAKESDRRSKDRTAHSAIEERRGKEKADRTSRVRASNALAVKEAALRELPFVLECPASHSEHVSHCVLSSRNSMLTH